MVVHAEFEFTQGVCPAAYPRPLETVSISRTKHEETPVRYDITDDITIQTERVEFDWDEAKETFNGWVNILNLPMESVEEIVQSSVNFHNGIICYQYNINIGAIRTYLETILKNWPDKVPRTPEGELLPHRTEDRGFALREHRIYMVNDEPESKHLTLTNDIRAALRWLTRRTMYENLSKTLSLTWLARHEMGKFARDWFDKVIIELDRLLDCRNFEHPNPYRLNFALVGVPEEWVGAMFAIPAKLEKTRGQPGLVTRKREGQNAAAMKQRAFELIIAATEQRVAREQMDQQEQQNWQVDEIVSDYTPTTDEVETISLDSDNMPGLEQILNPAREQNPCLPTDQQQLVNTARPTRAQRLVFIPSDLPTDNTGTDSSFTIMNSPAKKRKTARD